MACKNCKKKQVHTQAPEPTIERQTPSKIISLLHTGTNTKKRK